MFNVQDRWRELQISGSSPSVRAGGQEHTQQIGSAFQTMAEDSQLLGLGITEGLELRSCACTFGERLDRGSFVLLDIEYAVQFGSFQ